MKSCYATFKSISVKKSNIVTTYLHAAQDAILSSQMLTGSEGTVCIHAVEPSQTHQQKLLSHLSVQIPHITSSSTCKENCLTLNQGGLIRNQTFYDGIKEACFESKILKFVTKTNRTTYHYTTYLHNPLKKSCFFPQKNYVMPLCKKLNNGFLKPQIFT